MTEQTTNDGQKTVVAFIAGLLVGALLVWVFSDTPAEAPTETDDAAATEQDQTGDAENADDTETTSDEPTDATPDQTETPADESAPEAEPAAELPTGDASASVADTAPSRVVALESATYPTDNGWIAVRTYNDGEFTNILGAARYSREQGLIPEEIQLLTPTIAGQEYAIVFFTEDGDREFNLRNDTPIETPLITFTAE